MNAPGFVCADDLEAFLRGLAHSPSDEDGLTELEHLLQCVDVLRVAAPDDPGLQVAGLLHDIGWSLDPSGDHGKTGADAIAPLVGGRVTALVALHVDAKRYLVTRDPSYRAQLSPVSITTLSAQGADMSEHELATFEHHSHYLDAIQLRRADDLAKVPGKATASLEAWLPVLRLLIDREGVER